MMHVSTRCGLLSLAIALSHVSRTKHVELKLVWIGLAVDNFNIQDTFFFKQQNIHHSLFV